MSDAPELGIAAKFSLVYGAAEQSAFTLDVDLHLPGRGVTAVFGPSGSGKTTLLRCIAGLQSCKNGELLVNGDAWQSRTGFRPTHKRPLGFVFQEASLFAHLTAHQNLAYAVKRSRNPRMGDRYQRVVELLGIEPVLQQYPAQLSGGEKQRVAIARALLIDPHLLLMDEPLASLDAVRKQEILPYLEKLAVEFTLPILYVSHSIEEVARLADYLVVLEQGKVASQGPIEEVLSQIDLPVGLAQEVGAVVKATIVERDAHWHLVRASFDGGSLWLPDGGETIGQIIRVRILARDVSLTLTAQEDTSILNRMHAEIVGMAPDIDKAMTFVRIKMGSTLAVARVTCRSIDHLNIRIGAKVWAQIKSVAVVR